MSNSALAHFTLISPNRNSPRNHKIDRISIHCYVGQVTAQSGLREFSSTSKGASCNYVVGYDGSIGLCVPESDRSWCTSDPPNDHRAVTIETASDTTHPYAVTAKAYEALVDLVTDICRRNGAKKLIWFGDKNETLAYTPKAGEMVMTVHRWFSAKACPGDYLYERHGAIAAEVTRRLEGYKEDPVDYVVVVDAEDLNVRSGPGTDYSRVQTLEPGKYTIIAEADGAGATRWGKLKSGLGWISLDYAEKEDKSVTYEQWKEFAQQYEAEKATMAASKGWGETAQQWALEHGVIAGDPDGKLRPRSSITREEAEQMLKNYDEKVNKL